MIYLSGCITQTMLANPRPDLGIMLQPGMGNATLPLAHWDYALDNGCYAQGERFDTGNWLEWLAGLRRYRERCLFAVAPDVVGDAAATLARSLPLLPTIRQLGYRAAFVVQDGAEAPGMVPWDAFDVLFVGGTNPWKFGQHDYPHCLAAEARRRGKGTHYGRANSLRRLQTLQVSAFDSADGTFAKFGPDRNMPTVYDWLDHIHAQPPLIALQQPA